MTGGHLFPRKKKKRHHVNVLIRHCRSRAVRKKPHYHFGKIAELGCFCKVSEQCLLTSRMGMLLIPVTVYFTLINECFQNILLSSFPCCLTFFEKQRLCNLGLPIQPALWHWNREKRNLWFLTKPTCEEYFLDRCENWFACFFPVWRGDKSLSSCEKLLGKRHWSDFLKCMSPCWGRAPADTFGEIQAFYEA